MTISSLLGKSCGHVFGMLLVVKDVAMNSIDIAFFSAIGAMLEANDFTILFA